MEAIVTDQVVDVVVDRPGVAERIRGYYELTKPGITQMVVLTAAAGYYLSVGDNTYFTSIHNLLHFLLAMFGTAAISAGSCAWNQYLEREEDSNMKRTQKRPIPSGLIASDDALIFAIACSLVGAFALFYVNTLTFCLAIATHLSYTVLYTPLKKYSWTAMLLGGIPGALPAVGGWTAGSNGLEAGAWILFAIMFIWQMPHFLSLAIMYRQDYQRSGFAMLGDDEGSSTLVAKHVLVYTLILIPVGTLLYYFDIAGTLYLIGILTLGAFFVSRAIILLRDSSVINARKTLMASYTFLMGVFLFMFVDKI